MKTFFHPPCPKCGLLLQQCYDDNLLTSLGLQPYSTSLNRYLFCPACFESQGKSDYFTYSGKDFNPSILKDHKDLIKKFGQLNEVPQKTDPFPCMSCSSHQECYGAQGLAVSRIVPFSFYPFFMYILKDRLVNAVDFISLISGRLPEDLESQLAQKKEVGRMNCLKTIRQKGFDKTSFLFDKDERFFLEVLYLKLAFLGELFQIIFPATDSSHHHDFRFSIENIWLKLSDQGGRPRGAFADFLEFQSKIFRVRNKSSRDSVSYEVHLFSAPSFFGDCLVLLTSCQQQARNFQGL
jgi:hypothetical protein